MRRTGTRLLAWAEQVEARTPPMRRMSTRAHIGWWTAIVAAFVLAQFLSDRLGGASWPAKSVKGLGWLALTPYLTYRFTPDDQPRPSMRAVGITLLCSVSVIIGLGYLFSR